MANSYEIRRGQQVFTIGSPIPTDTSVLCAVTNGIICKPLYRYENVESRIMDTVVSDEHTVGGNSGGPLLNIDGEVVGMFAAGDGVETNCSSYASPSNTPFLLLGDVRRGHLQQGQLYRSLNRYTSQLLQYFIPRLQCPKLEPIFFKK